AYSVFKAHGIAQNPSPPQSWPGNEQLILSQKSKVMKPKSNQMRNKKNGLDGLPGTAPSAANLASFA
ncbi:MAG: hypothetical protein WBE38_01210, partial [Terracidiphilus sp.]